MRACAYIILWLLANKYLNCPLSISENIWLARCVCGWSMMDWSWHVMEQYDSLAEDINEVSQRKWAVFASAISKVGERYLSMELIPKASEAEVGILEKKVHIEGVCISLGVQLSNKRARGWWEVAAWHWIKTILGAELLKPWWRPTTESLKAHWRVKMR